MHKRERPTDLIEVTANALSDNVVAVMLLAVQKDNLEPNIKQAIGWAHSAFEKGHGSTETVMKKCIQAFPSLWLYESREFEEREESFEFPEEFVFFEEFEEEFERINTITSGLRSFIANPPFSLSSDDKCHIMIVTILILERACLFFCLIIYAILYSGIGYGLFSIQGF